MKMENKGKSVIKEVPWGVYVWECPDGEILGDGDGNFMMVFTTEGNQRDIQELREAARGYGFPEGKPVWWGGVRPVSDEEYEHQLARAEAGLTPDPLDIGAIRDEMAALKEQNK